MKLARQNILLNVRLKNHLRVVDFNHAKILANKTVSMTELRDPAKVLANAGDAPVAVLNRNKVVGYFVPNSAVEDVVFEQADDEEVQKTADASIAQHQSILTYLKDK
uniref:Uncharacterized protein n=1 Tax=uncultured Thiotrichaceae bacterium TaxID=298394 RepID=A0A6S6SFW0_9GAMM|nr:MAG: Unknown protein [uncultured Thiotrichaceae bacterium]